MHIEFDYELCKKCNLCHRVCGSHQIMLDDENKPYLRENDSCIDCGHCMAVCPVGAVVNTKLDSSQIIPMKDPNISYEQLVSLIRNRRSIRLYKQKPLSNEHIDKILHAVQYIPTGSNEQSLEYIIIQDPKILDEIKEGLAKKFAYLCKLANSFIGKIFVDKKNRIDLQLLVENWKLGNDPYLRHAPCLLIIYSKKKYFGISAWDAGIATYNIDLTAQTLGVGTLLNGFHAINTRLFKSLKKKSKLPKKSNILATMCLGYPDIKYRNTVSRRALKVKKYPEE